jgi:GMP synthase (glutamine-hydrolysing)
MVKIAVIDNGGQYAHRIYRTFQDCGAEVEIFPNTTPVEEIKADGIAFSGSGLMIGQGEAAGMGNCALYLDKFNGPILGMCAGHQLIASHFGGEAKEAATPEFGKTEILIDAKDEIFEGLPEKIIAWNSHNDEVASISENMESLAHSKDCPHEAVKHKTKPIYGLQFHPEVQHTEYGYEIFENFVKICKNFKAVDST